MDIELEDILVMMMMMMMMTPWKLQCNHYHLNEKMNSYQPIPLVLDLAQQ